VVSGRLSIYDNPDRRGNYRRSSVGDKSFSAKFPEVCHRFFGIGNTKVDDLSYLYTGVFIDRSFAGHPVRSYFHNIIYFIYRL